MLKIILTCKELNIDLICPLKDPISEVQGVHAGQRRGFETLCFLRCMHGIVGWNLEINVNITPITLSCCLPTSSKSISRKTKCPETALLTCTDVL